jgi:hypothetical protein
MCQRGFIAPQGGLESLREWNAMVVVKIWRRSAPVWSEEFKMRRWLADGEVGEE